MIAANDNARPNYRRKPCRQRSAPAARPILAWEIDSALHPGSEAGMRVIGQG